MTYKDPGFGVSPPSEYGTLTTCKQFDSHSQKYDAKSKKYIGQFPTLNGDNKGYYEALAKTVLQGAPLQAKAETSRDEIRLMELARKSHETGATVPWS